MQQAFPRGFGVKKDRENDGERDFRFWPEIPVGKSNGSRHFVGEGSENLGCDLRRRNFPRLSSLFGKFGYILWRFVLPPL